MGHSVAQVHQGGQQPVDEHQPVPGTRPDRPPPPRPIGQPRVPARLSARSQLGDQLSQNLPGQPGHPAIGDSGGTGQRPRHATTLLRPSHQPEHAVPLTMHEVVTSEPEAHTAWQTGHQ
jgi:hypothetical protein